MLIKMSWQRRPKREYEQWTGHISLKREKLRLGSWLKLVYHAQSLRFNPQHSKEKKRREGNQNRHTQEIEREKICARHSGTHI
jgi:hypothetical protein